MPSVILVSSKDIIKLESGGKLFAAVLSVSPSQIRLIAPAYYERLKGKRSIVVSIVHADPAGNIDQQSLELLEASCPDAVFCCFPTYARRLHPELPIVGHSGKAVRLYYEDSASRVVRLTISED